MHLRLQQSVLVLIILHSCYNSLFFLNARSCSAVFYPCSSLIPFFLNPFATQFNSSQSSGRCPLKICHLICSYLVRESLVALQGNYHKTDSPGRCMTSYHIHKSLLKEAAKTFFRQTVWWKERFQRPQEDVPQEKDLYTISP